MPPRRSCFHPVSREDVPGLLGFNATTAFLLQAHPKASLAYGLPFQCHHGVPAYRLSDIQPTDLLEFQCHHGVPASSPLAMGPWPFWPFQCHHGVPASQVWDRRDRPFPRVSMPPRRSCFQFGRRRGSAFMPVSMPPRRSCFPGRLDRVIHVHMRFNATTAFLLRWMASRASVRKSGFNATTAFLLRPRWGLGL